MENYTSEAAQKVLTDRNAVCTIASRNGKQVGVYVILHHACPLLPYIAVSELKHLYLLSEEYGTGLGKAMLEHAFQVVKKEKKEWVWLCVSNLNSRAQKFYKKMGFEAIGDGPVLEVGTDRLRSTIMIRRM